MNQLFQPWFADQLAAMEQQVTPPLPPFHWGVDLQCTTDIPEDFPEIPADTYQGIGESVLRRLLTPRGGLVDDANYGDGLIQMIHHGVTVQELSGIQQRISDECRKDDRVNTADVVISPVPDPLSSGVAEVTVTINANDKDQAFDLIFAVDGTGHIVDVMINRQIA